MADPVIGPVDRGSSDYYRLLGLPPKATVEQVKAGYRRRARRYHPDVNGGDVASQERFKLCSEAYEALSDPQQRYRYDSQRWASRSPRDLLSGVLAEVMGGPLWSRQDGRDVEAALDLSLEECALGTSRTLRLLVDSPCGDCAGSGAARGGETSCTDCGGRGERGGSGILALPRPCGLCGGRGRRVAHACQRCGGVGSVELERVIAVPIRPGAADGERIVRRGQGEPGVQGGRPGDLRVTLRLRPHPLFTRAGQDLELVLPVSLEVAALGGTVEVPTLDGCARLKIPPGTQSGTLLRLRGKGMALPGGPSDLLVRVAVETPVELDEGQRKRLLGFAKACTVSNQPAQSRFKDAVTQLQAERQDRIPDGPGES